MNNAIAYYQVPLEEVKTELPKFKLSIKLGIRRIAVSQQGNVIGFLLPIKDIYTLQENNVLNSNRSFKTSLSDFRRELVFYAEQLQSEQAKLDCVIVTFNNREAIAFLHSKFTPYLNIPVSDVSYKLLELI